MNPAELMGYLSRKAQAARKKEIADAEAYRQKQEAHVERLRAEIAMLKEQVASKDVLIADQGRTIRYVTEQCQSVMKSLEFARLQFRSVQRISPEVAFRANRDAVELQTEGV